MTRQQSRDLARWVVVSKVTKVAPGALEWELLVLVASLSSWDKAGCTCPSILSRSLFQKKLYLSLDGAPALCTCSNHGVPVEYSCLNAKSACLGVPVLITMALPPTVCVDQRLCPVLYLRRT